MFWGSQDISHKILFLCIFKISYVSHLEIQIPRAKFCLKAKLDNDTLVIKYDMTWEIIHQGMSSVLRLVQPR